MQKVHAVVWQEDSWWVAKALEVEVASQGKSEKSALANLKEALELYFEDQTKVELTPVHSPKLQDMAIQTNA
ncbi:type II toxin-antitoxin system HicB family antitoxin [Candidatus Microgenomates bacterium]|nr:type II toxin-antitoxin system HicB family antitoxin [Candidatus Microgenomates bacterium]